MDGIYPGFTVRTCFSFLVLVLLQTSTEAQICTSPIQVPFPENNTIGKVVTEITIEDGVNLTFKTPQPNDQFILEGNQLIANKVFDYEVLSVDPPTYTIKITCTKAGAAEIGIVIVVILGNLNDNPPHFAQQTYSTDVNELSPVNSTVRRFAATDLDQTTIYYRLVSGSASPQNAFRLESVTNPNLLVVTPLEYDKVKNVQLVLEAQDTDFRTPVTGPSYTATATINVAIKDVDNRPPWFQPCTQSEAEGALICQSVGYTGRVVLNEQQEGALPLKPGPLHAIDGDSGINEEITYSFLGYTGDLFAISPTTGNITMLKPANVFETVSLSVLAAQKVNSFQYATTTVSISVQLKSLHLPEFQKSQYSGVISSVGSMAVDSTGEPLQIMATDEDFATTGGLNPHMTYSVIGSDDFSVINGYLFMTKELPDGTLSLQLKATDSTNDESDTAQLSVEVKLSLTTSPATPFTEESTTDSKTTGVTESTSMTTDGSVSTAISSTAGESTVSTSDPSMTSEGGDTTANPPTEIAPSGDYTSTDMAILGAVLGVLLFSCVIVIVVLALRVQKGVSFSKKIYESNMFRSTWGKGPGGPKETMQYTNEAFDNDEDGDSPGSSGLEAGQKKPSEGFIQEDAMRKTAAPPQDLHLDDTSLDTETDADADVKPILTKEKRTDDGYKSVWFREDIDPNAKEEVVIIPDNSANDSEEEEEEDEEDEEEEESSEKEDNEDDRRGLKTPRVVFNETDLDSGLGVKVEDRGADSDDEEKLSYQL
ncbi:cadherin-related family member 5 [Xyrichtys novacula]|uniref:Cadherin-related family member 5 n=1 Tax=Xyrichtys novacula TaxID=13765 RepID=A0AAV1F5K5_XYRNO|nr:cadherin-related family member 5 [Xyrichtys novacula]